MKQNVFTQVVVCLAFVLVCRTLLAEPVDIAPHVAKLRAVGPKGEGHREATAAWQALAKADAEQLPEILAGMQGVGRLSENWFRAAVEAVAQRQVKQGGALPIAKLEAFLADTKQSPRARRLAYELVASVDSAAKGRLIPKLVNDPSLELRRDAIAVAFENAAALEKGADQQPALAAYREIFVATRALDQIKAASGKLKALGDKVDVPQHMGFLMHWKLIGPFDNVADKGYETAYPPEHEINLAAKYDGKIGPVSWTEYTTADEFGIVDLNAAFKRPKEGEQYKLTEEHKGAVAYAYTEFQAPAARDVQLRIGCINGNKVWLNGDLLTANHVYHTGMEVDQYLAEGKLQPGVNTILVKVCQNEQSEAWAQSWQFQLRVCDEIGTAVLSQDRTLNKTAAR